MTTNPDGQAGANEAPGGLVIWRKIRSLGVVTDVVTAAGLCGIGRTAAYEQARAGTLPFPVLKFGAQYRVPVVPLLAVLGLTPDMDEAAVATAATVTAATVQEPQDHGNTLRAV